MNHFWPYLQLFPSTHSKLQLLSVPQINPVSISLLSSSPDTLSSSKALPSSQSRLTYHLHPPWSPTPGVLSQPPYLEPPRQKLFKRLLICARARDSLNHSAGPLQLESMTPSSFIFGELYRIEPRALPKSDSVRFDEFINYESTNLNTKSITS